MSISDVCGIITVFIAVYAIVLAKIQIKLTNEYKKLDLANRLIEFIDQCGIDKLINTIIDLNTPSKLSITKQLGSDIKSTAQQDIDISNVYKMFYILRQLKTLNIPELNILIFNVISGSTTSTVDSKISFDKIKIREAIHEIYICCNLHPKFNLKEYMSSWLNIRKLNTIEKIKSIFMGKYLCTKCNSQFLKIDNLYCFYCHKPTIEKQSNIFGKYIW